MPEQPHQFSRIAEELVGELRHVPLADQATHNIGGRRAHPRNRPTQTLAALVEQQLQENRIGREAPEHTIREHWREIVDPGGGTANSSHSHPVTIERNMLNVITSHPIVRNELFFHREEIVARIRKLPGCENVKALNLRSG